MEIVLPEIVAVGIYNSQIAVPGVTVTKNRTTKMFEIELPVEKGGVSYIDSAQRRITSDALICAKPGQIRHTMLPYKCYYIHMILKNGTLGDMLSDIPDFVETKRSEEYRKIFAEMCKYYDSLLESDKIIIQSLVLKLIHMLYNDSKRQSHKGKTNGNYETIETAIGYIKNNLTSDLSLAAVAAYASLSPIHFHNCFKAATGRTLHEYVEEQRIKKAANLLVTTDKTLTEISYECGFSSQSYFSYAFKRRMQITPREYAKEIYKRYDI